jgi:hypothetical protein
MPIGTDTADGTAAGGMAGKAIQAGMVAGAGVVVCSWAADDYRPPTVYYPPPVYYPPLGYYVPRPHYRGY